MILVTIREPIVLPPDDIEGEERPIDQAAAERIARILWGEDAAIAWAAWSAHLPNGIGDDGRPLGWSMREVRQLRFARWRAERGDFDGDRFGLAPEPLPTIDPADLGRNER